MENTQTRQQKMTCLLKAKRISFSQIRNLAVYMEAADPPVHGTMLAYVEKLELAAFQAYHLKR